MTLNRMFLLMVFILSHFLSAVYAKPKHTHTSRDLFFCGIKNTPQRQQQQQKPSKFRRKMVYVASPYNLFDLLNEISFAPNFAKCCLI